MELGKILSPLPSASVVIMFCLPILLVPTQTLNSSEDNCKKFG
jgi:hypothetical protein